LSVVTRCFLVYIFHSSAARWWVAFVTDGKKLNVLTTVDSREFVSLALEEIRKDASALHVSTASNFLMFDLSFSRP
jgi:hypothetical protein